jgi:hypothetical protein
VTAGSIKVEVSPVYGFRYEADSLNYVKGKVREFWYEKNLIQKQSEKINDF